MPTNMLNAQNNSRSMERSCKVAMAKHLLRRRSVRGRLTSSSMVMSCSDVEVRFLRRQCYAHRVCSCVAIVLHFFFNLIADCRQKAFSMSSHDACSIPVSSPWFVCA
eukprot:596576-Amphidinium_carterae.1